MEESLILTLLNISLEVNSSIEFIFPISLRISLILFSEEISESDILK